MLIEAKNGAEQTAKGETEDEENRILCLLHVLHRDVHAEHESGKSHGGVQDGDVFFSDAFASHGSDGTADNDGNGVDDDCVHKF